MEVKKVVMNKTRKGVLDLLKSNAEGLTLAEIGEKLGKKVVSGTTNAMLQAGYIKVVGTKKVPVITYREVSVYALGDNAPAEAKAE